MNFFSYLGSVITPEENNFSTAFSPPKNKIKKEVEALLGFITKSAAYNKHILQKHGLLQNEIGYRESIKIDVLLEVTEASDINPLVLRLSVGIQLKFLKTL